MRILFVVPYVPGPVRTRSYNLIRSLSARGHQITVAAVCGGDVDRRLLPELQRICHAVEAVDVSRSRSLVNCLRALPSGEPLQAWYSWSPRLSDRIGSMLPGFDVVHVEHLRAAKYGLAARARAGRSGPAVVWDSVDCISFLFAQAVQGRVDWLGRMISRFELERTRRYEGRVATEFDQVLITSPLDRAALVELMSATGRAERAVRVVPNGVDTSYFTATGEPRDSRTVVFSGKMSYHANVAAADFLVRAIMPIVWSRMPDVELTIVGQDPGRRVRALATTGAPRVTVTGSVPDVRPYLRTAAIAVVPLVYGAGSQFKVLEAMACGAPVIATPRAVGALMAAPGRDLVVADGAETFAQAILDLLADPGRRCAIGRSGRDYVEKHHGWDQIALQVEELYRELTSIPAAGRSPEPTVA